MFHNNIKCISWIISICLWVVWLFSATMTYAVQRIDWSVLSIPLEQYEIQTRVGNPTSSVGEQVLKIWWVAGMNGSYFCPAETAYERCGADNDTDAERIVAGKEHSIHPYETDGRGIFGFDRHGQFLLVQQNRSQHGYAWNKNAFDRDDVYYGIGNFPMLLVDGKEVVSQYQSWDFWTGLVTFGTKWFICITQDEQTVFMWFVPLQTVYTLPWYLQSRYGCHNAINLDAGQSTALYVDDQYILWPGREVVDGYVVVPKQSQFVGRKSRDDNSVVIAREEEWLPQYHLSQSDFQLVYTLQRRIETIRSDLSKQEQNTLLYKVNKYLQSLEDNKRLQWIILTAFEKAIN